MRLAWPESGARWDVARSRNLVEAAMDPNVIMNRLIRLAKLDTTVFDEVRDD